MKLKKILTGIVAFVMMVLVTVPAFANPVGRCETCGGRAGKVIWQDSSWRDCNGGNRHYTTIRTWQCSRDGDIFDTITESCGWCR